MVTGTHGLLSHCQTASWRDPGRRRGGSSMVAETHPPPPAVCMHSWDVTYHTRVWKSDCVHGVSLLGLNPSPPTH